MTNFLDFARFEVDKYVRNHLDKSEATPDFEVFVVWSCKTCRIIKLL